VAGIVAAEANNGNGSAGVCWTAKIMVVKIANDTGITTADLIADGIQYAINNGANIINFSAGGKGYSGTEYSAIKDARDAGLLFVAAAGNDAYDNDRADPEYPASYDLENIISVAATDHNDALASFSNYGATSVDVGAPGDDIYSTRPNNTYAIGDGTSFAAPFATGLAGLIWHNNTILTYSQVKGVILNGVDAKGGLAGKVETGGRINADTSLDLPVPPSGPTDLKRVSRSKERRDLEELTVK